MKSFYYYTLTTLVALGNIRGTNAFSITKSISTTTKATTKSSPNNNIFSSSILQAPLSQIQRNTLKKKLIKAASQKDEEQILTLVTELSKLNPTPIPTLGLMGYKGNGDNISNNAKSKNMAAPLNGRWELLYTNAKDAESPARTKRNKNEAFGDEVEQGIDVKTGQIINAELGQCVNYIQLSSSSSSLEVKEDNSNEKKKNQPPFDKLEITIQMTPLSNNRVRLDFIKGKAWNENAIFSFLKTFEFYFPPPSFGDVLARLRGLDPSIEPQAYFDVLYIDEEIRAHRTGEGKIFIQKRDNN
jgi:hypothetical protein